MRPFRGPRPVRETAGGQSALTSGPAPAHRRPTRQRPLRCPSTETSADSTGPAARRSAPTRVELPLLRGQPGTTRRVVPLLAIRWSHDRGKLDSNGPMNVASDNALPRMRNHLQCHKSRSRRWRQHTPVACDVDRAFEQLAGGRVPNGNHLWRNRDKCSWRTTMVVPAGPLRFPEIRSTGADRLSPDCPP